MGGPGGRKGAEVCIMGFSAVRGPVLVGFTLVLDASAIISGEVLGVGHRG